MVIELVEKVRVEQYRFKGFSKFIGSKVSNYVYLNLGEYTQMVIDRLIQMEFEDFMYQDEGENRLIIIGSEDYETVIEGSDIVLYQNIESRLLVY